MIMDISDYTIEDLTAEIQRREKVENTPPEMLENFYLEPMIKILSEYVKEIQKDDYCDDNDFEHYIYETAINCFFGKEFWEWYNKKVK